MIFTKETFKRMLKTFLQSALAYFLINAAVVDYTSEKEAIRATLTGLAISSLAAGISAAMNLEQKGAGGMSFDFWVNSYIGRKTDFDGAYGVQCVDLIDCYIAKCLCLNKGFWGNAKDWWIKRSSSKWLKDNFEFISPKYNNGELKKGDIGIRTSGKYGHIFIIAEPSKNGRIKYYDQNASGNGDAMTMRDTMYTSDYINGVLRPKKRDNIDIVSYIVGNTYKLAVDLKVRYGADISFQQKNRAELTPNAKLHSKNDKYAILKLGTKVTVLEIKKNGADIWLRIPSGWIAAYYNGNIYVK